VFGRPRCVAVHVSERPDSTVTLGHVERRVRSIYVEHYIISSDRYDLTYEILNVTRGANRLVVVGRPDVVGMSGQARPACPVAPTCAV
jgi:hypothetical protein